MDRGLRNFVAAKLPTTHGSFEMHAFAREETDRMPHLALVHKEMDTSEPVPVRIHSECITGDVFGSTRCDCGAQLDASLKIAATKKGIVLYLRQEGRGIGIINKLKAYQLQDQGLNTADANIHLGLEVDARAYEDAVIMLEKLGVKRILLMTNNPDKLEAIDRSTIDLVDRIPLIIPAQKDSEAYLRTKRELMGHLLAI